MLGHHKMISDFLCIRTQHEFDTFKVDLEKKIAERHYVIDNQRSVIIEPSQN